MTYKQLLDEAKQQIRKASLEEDVAKLLLMHYTQERLANIYANLDKIADEKVIKSFNNGIKKYVNKQIPLGYITGVETFFGYEFIVNKNVLIPRRETEELVERLIYYITDNYDNNINLLDIGAGSGCIGITLDKELKNVNVTATDISRKAIKVAKLNNEKLLANVSFVRGDLFEPVANKKFDVIVSNPPYIVKEGYIGKTVKHEPKISLYGGIDGLDFYRKIIFGAKAHLKNNGLIAFEHAFDTAEQIKEIALNAFANAKVTCYKDLSGYDRITFIEIGEING